MAHHWLSQYSSSRSSSVLYRSSSMASRRSAKYTNPAIVSAPTINRNSNSDISNGGIDIQSTALMHTLNNRFDPGVLVWARLKLTYIKARLLAMAYWFLIVRGGK